MSNQNTMGYKCSCMVSPGKITYEHNIRDPELVEKEEHIDPEEYSEVTVNLGHLDEAYKKIFGDSIEEYNKGLRKDRQITDYLELIKNDLRKGKHLNQKADSSRKPAYEAIIQIGCRDNQPDREQAKKILKLFVEKWIPSHYPNIKPILIAYHGDEFSIDKKTKEKIYSPIHCHFDFVYIAHCLSDEEKKKEKLYREKAKEEKKKQLAALNIPFDEKLWKKKDWQEDLVKRTGKSLTKGMSLQSSMSSALLEMGFKTGNGTTAQILFEEQLRHDLQDFAESMGLKIDRTPGEKHKHDEKSVYQEKQELKKDKSEFEIKKQNWTEKTIKTEEQLKVLEMQIQKQIEVNEVKSLKNKEREEFNKSKEIELNSLKSNLCFKQDFLKQNQRLCSSFEKTVNDVQLNHKSIESAEKEFWSSEETKSLDTRIRIFINNCKEIVTSLATQLSKYKQAFERFWKWKPKQFRQLADDMEKNGCPTFEVYHACNKFGRTKETSEIRKNTSNRTR